MSDEEAGRTRRSGFTLASSHWLFAVALMGSALALGTLHSLTLCIVGGVLALTLALAWTGREPMRPRRAASIVLIVGVGLAIYTALQAVPLPAALIASIAPQNADVWSRALTPLHEAGPATATLSLDPVATHIEVLRGVCYVLAFLIAVRLASGRRGVVFLECAIVATAFVLGAAALLHPAFGVAKVFGVYEHGPGIEPRHVSPLLNANHLAGYLNIGFCIALASALASQPEVPRLVSIAVAAFLVGVQLWVASRGGVAAMAIGALLVIGMSRVGNAARPKLITWLAAGAMALAGIGMIVLSSSDEAWLELANTDVSKFQLFKQAMRLVAQSPFVGVGRGAFQSTFPAVRTGNDYGDWTHPENVIAQWTCEWGVPVAVVAGALLVFALRPSVALARSRPTVGPWAALATVGVHNLVDFNSEVPAIILALAACAAMCVAGSPERAPRRALDSWATRPRLVAAIGVAALAGAVLWVLPNLGRELEQDRKALRVAALDPSVPAARFQELARAAILRHPAEPYLPFAGAIRASRAQDESVVPWIARAFERARVYGPAHFLLARALVRRSPAQARMEYRFAAEQAPGLTSMAAHEALRLVHDFDDALEVTPDGPAGLDTLEVLALGLSDRLPATRVRIDEEILSRKADAMAPLLRQADDLRRDLLAGDAAPWCAASRASCIERGEALATRMREIAPTKCEPYATHARLLIAAGEPRRALDALQQASEKVSDREVCLTQLVQAAAAAGDEARLTVALDKLAHAGCAKDADCITNWRYVAQVEEGRGNRSRAFALYKKILERAPHDDVALATVARLASQIGMHAEAIEAYKGLLLIHPNDAQINAAMAAEKEALYRSPLKTFKR